MKKVLKWGGITIGGIFILLLILPFLFKGKIVKAVKNASNEQLNAHLNFSDVDLSLIRNFPNLRISIENVTIDNAAPFDSVRLASIGELVTVVDLSSLFGDEIKIRRIKLVSPNFDIRVLKDGRANWDIAKADSSAAAPAADQGGSGFKMKLNEYSIESGVISYHDMSMPMLIKLNNFNHTGSGDFTQDVFNLVTHSKADAITFWFDGITYINEAKADFDFELGMDLKQMKFTLAGNKILLNDLELGTQGWVAMPGEDIDMDIQFKATETDFKSLLSMVPLEFAKDVKGVNASGNMAFDGYVTGKYNDKSMPGIGLNLTVDNGSFKYPDLPGTVNDIQVKAAIVADMNVMDRTTIDVDRFHLSMEDNPVDMRLKLRTPESDPDIDFACKAQVDLDKIRNFIPLKKGEDVHGQIRSDIAIKGRKSFVDKGQYDQFQATGTLDILNVLFKSDSLPYDLNVDKAHFAFTPAFIELSEFGAKIGRSDIQANGKFDHYLEYALYDSTLTGAFNLTSSLLDLNEFMASEDPSTNAGSSASETPKAQSDTTSSGPIALPGNIHFQLNASIAKMLYETTEISNVKGGIVLKDKIAYLKNLNMQVLDGTVMMDGNYNAQSLAAPKMDFNFDMVDMDIQKTAKQFVTVRKLAPITQAATGRFSSSLRMNSILSKDMMPVNATVNGGGKLSTKNAVIKEFKPLVKIAEITKLEKLKSLPISDVNLSFKIVNGVVNVDPFVVKLDGVPTKIWGSTTLDQAIDYNMEMDIPFEKFPAGLVNQANSLLALANQKLGTNISAGQKLPVKLKITGTVTDPKIATNYGDIGSGAASNLKDQMLDAGKQAAAQELDKIRQQALEKAQAEKARLVAEAQAQADRLVAEAQKQAEQAKKEGASLAQKGKDAAYKSAQDIENSAKNPLEKAGKKIAADKIRKEADNVYNNAVAKSNTEADKLVDQARKQGEKLVAEAASKGDQLISNANSSGQSGIDQLKK